VDGTVLFLEVVVVVLLCPLADVVGVDTGWRIVVDVLRTGGRVVAVVV
jgi:hypothetical protein